jgi:hypothetical protein
MAQEIIEGIVESTGVRKFDDYPDKVVTVIHFQGRIEDYYCLGRHLLAGEKIRAELGPCTLEGDMREVSRYLVLRTIFGRERVVHSDISA